MDEQTLDRRPRALVVGCATGIGAAGVRRLADRGFRIAALDRSPTVEALGVEVGADFTAVVDVGDTDAFTTQLEAAVEALGGLDAAWSNVGIQSSGSVEDLLLDDLDQAWAVNVRAHVVFARGVVPALRTAGGGALLLTASNSGLMAEQAMVAYSVTKAATVALGKCLARDHAADRIRVNTLCPGYVDTPFNGPIWSRVGGRDAFLADIGATIPLGRMATADEVGAMAAWLLSPEASYVTGQAMVADGGELVC